MKKRNKTKFNIFPGGDRVFVVGTGDNIIKARVSGAVISRASEVFAAMLTSGFRESDQKEIPLQDENPDVMLDFFHIIHGQANLEQRGGQRLIGLAVMADMWMCAGALKEWMKEQLHPVTQNLSLDTDLGISLPTPSTMNTKKETLFWESMKGTSTSYRSTLRSSKGVILSFDIKDLVELAVVIGIDDLLWYSSRISLAYSYYDAETDIFCRMAIPPRGKGVEDNSIHNVIAKSSREYTSKFLSEVLDCLGRGFMSGTILYLDDMQMCRRGQLLRNAMMLFLQDEDILAREVDDTYPYSLKHAIQSVGKLPLSMRADYFFKKIIARNCGLQDLKERNGNCSYCVRDFQSELKGLITRHLQELPGICRDCYLEDGVNFFTSEPCPKHS